VFEKRIRVKDSDLKEVGAGHYAKPDEVTLPPLIPGKHRIVVRRVPYDDYVTVYLPDVVNEGEVRSEYVLMNQAAKLLRMYGVKDPDSILGYAWNFYEAVIYVNIKRKN
jgi:hypothetical protein